MASLQFTPLATDATPNPSQVTITALNGFLFSQGPIKRLLEIVHIEFTDFSFLRDLGREMETIIVSGTETFAVYSDAEQFIGNLAKLQGAECDITHDDGSTTASCLDIGQPVIQFNNFPNYHIVYNLVFKSAVQ